MTKNVKLVRMDTISWNIHKIAMEKYQKVIILMRQRKFIWNAMRLVKLAP